MNTTEPIKSILKSSTIPLAPRSRFADPRWKSLAGVTVVTLGAVAVLANGGPFVVKYPGGDPAAKGVLARLDPGLQPAREARLAVVSENLTIRFEPEQFVRTTGRPGAEATPLVAVTAEYFITNTTGEAVEVDFGFPILRGIYVSPFSMMPMPDAQVRVDGTNHLRPALISNSAIYGILRRRAANAIEHRLEGDPPLDRLFQACLTAAPETRESARRTLNEYLIGKKGWSSGDAALLAEYAALQPAKPTQAAAPAGKMPASAGFFWWEQDATLLAAKSETLWAVQAIGEQKATQWLTRLAALIDRNNASSYEAIFQSWGGDVREKSVDLLTGQTRPREITSTSAPRPAGYRGEVLAQSDPTVYARVDYLGDNAGLTDGQKASWNTVLRHLPVIFTFAPMNLLHYRVAFAPGAVRTVSVSYRQYAYLDSRSPRSYQLGYVIHPASLWNSFGPIHLTVATPVGVTPVASVSLGESAEFLAGEVQEHPGAPRLSYGARFATVTEKTGELFVGIDADAWAKAVSPPAAPQPTAKTTAQR